MLGSSEVEISLIGETEMATDDYTATNSNGVTYALTYVPWNLLSNPLGPNYTLVITYPASDGSQPETITGIPTGNVLTSDGGTFDIASALVGSTYVIPPGVSGSVDLLVSLATLTDNVLYVGGTATISSNVSVLSGLTVHVDGGTVTAANGNVAGALSGMTIDLDDGGTFSNGSALIGVLNNTTINFGTNGGTFVANAGGTLLDLSSLTINGFDNATDKIEFGDLSAPLSSYNITTSGSSQVVTMYSAEGHDIGTVTISGTSLETGTFAAGQTGPLGVVESGSGSDWNITLNAGGGVVPCFFRGTIVATSEGGKSVESLKIGDLVITNNGTAVPVRWIGRRTVSAVFSDPLRALPIRICVDALGGGVPRQDVLISPDHALLIDGVLVNAGALVNGVSIVRETNVPRNFVYYHIEVENHALIMVEGLAAETFIDHVGRTAFDNWAEHVAIFGNTPMRPEMCYPRVKSARQLPRALRARLERHIKRDALTAA